MRNCKDTLGLINRRFVDQIKPIEIYKSEFKQNKSRKWELIFISLVRKEMSQWMKRKKQCG